MLRGAMRHFCVKPMCAWCFSSRVGCCTLVERLHEGERPGAQNVERGGVLVYTAVVGCCVGFLGSSPCVRPTARYDVRLDTTVHHKLSQPLAAPLLLLCPGSFSNLHYRWVKSTTFSAC